MKGVAAFIAPMLLGVSFVLLAASSLAQVPAAPGGPQVAEDPWRAARFLVGDWVGEGGGQPGAGSGSFSFRFDLEDKVLVRRNHTEYPAAGNKPATAHDDLMVCFRDPGEERIRAIYFDNEGHVIRYAVDSPQPGRLVLVSDVSGSAPGFRLTYAQVGPDRVKIAFEIAPPGRPGEFVPYLSGIATRKASP